MPKELGFGSPAILTIGSPNLSTVGLTHTAYAINASTGTAYSIGTEDGAAAGTDVDIDLDFSTTGLAAGQTYRIEAWDGDDRRWAPNDADPEDIYITLVARPAPAA